MAVNSHSTPSVCRKVIFEACDGLDEVNADRILEDALKNLFDGVQEADVNPALVMSARVLIEQEPNYSYVAASLLLDGLRREALTFVEGVDTEATLAEMDHVYPVYFENYIHKAAELKLLDHELEKYDLARLGKASETRT